MSKPHDVSVATYERVSELKLSKNPSYAVTCLRDMINDFRFSANENARAGYGSAAVRYNADAKYCQSQLKELG